MSPDDDGSIRPWAEVAERIRELAAACREGGLNRLRVVDHDLEVEVRISQAAPAATISPPETSTETPQRAPVPSLNGAVAHGPEPAYVKSDVVGTVRLSRPAVAEGEVLSGERELAYVESLGVRNPVSSGGGGRVVGVLVEDGQPVDYGQPLFAIER